MNEYCAVDLFAGAGGLSEGFTQAGIEVISHVEKNTRASETLKTRAMFHELKKKNKLEQYFKYQRNEDISREEILENYPDILEKINRIVINEEIREDNFDEIIKRLEDIRATEGYNKYNLVLGGPPCQAYSLAGRARDKEGMNGDDRHFLYEFYLKALEELMPEIFVFENVPGLLSASSNGEYIFKRIIEDMENLTPSYEIASSFELFAKTPQNYILNSNNYGVPQNRERLFLIGYRKYLSQVNNSIRDIFERIIREGQKKAISGRKVKDAISDLPPITPAEREKEESYDYDEVDDGDDYWYPAELKHNTSSNGYLDYVRKDAPEGGVSNHRARGQLKSDRERYKKFIELGFRYGDEENPQNVTLNELEKEDKSLLPDHDNRTSFLDRFKVQFYQKPSYTITKHIHKDGHYYIHPDKEQARSFTVREAARCQSFPDNYIFEGPRTEQFKQVGNAVPPLLAKWIGKFVKEELEKIDDFRLPPSKDELTYLRRNIFHWFEENGRVFPWRKSEDPFKVLIAEMMLQRTKAKQAKEVYLDFFDKYQSPEDVAKANKEDIKRILKPLGLDWRVEKIIRVCNVLVEDFEGEIPKTRENLEELPGVAQYISGMVSSLAYHKKEWVIDSNVVRVFKRFFALNTKEEARRDPILRWTAGTYIKTTKPKEANLGLVDFGAKVCRPSSPLCNECPLAKKCSNYESC
mgnify:CR=1 FL=1